MKLTKINVDSEIRKYVEGIDNILTPLRSGILGKDTYKSLYFLKREPICDGPYPNVSPFEACNRIFSDLVILFGIQRLLNQLQVQFPFEEYEVALGTAQGTDILARSNNADLIGEAFNVAPTFFPNKERSVRRKLMEADSKYKVVIFNSDAVANPLMWDLKDDNGITYLIVDIEAKLLGLKSGNQQILQ